MGVPAQLEQLEQQYACSTVLLVEHQAYGVGLSYEHVRVPGHMPALSEGCVNRCFHGTDLPSAP